MNTGNDIYLSACISKGEFATDQGLHILWPAMSNTVSESINIPEQFTVIKTTQTKIVMNT